MQLRHGGMTSMGFGARDPCEPLGFPLESDRAPLAEEVERLRRERDQARREATEERDQARQERDRLLGLVEATQKLLEDQSRDRRRGWRRIFGGL